MPPKKVPKTLKIKEKLSLDPDDVIDLLSDQLYDLMSSYIEQWIYYHHQPKSEAGEVQLMERSSNRAYKQTYSWLKKLIRKNKKHMETLGKKDLTTYVREKWHHEFWT